MGQGGSHSRAWGLTWCSAPPGGRPHALLPTPRDLSLAAPSLHPSRPLDPQTPTRPSLVCSLTFPGARGGSQGIRASWGFLCRLPPSRAPELRTADPVLSGERGRKLGLQKSLAGEEPAGCRGRSWATFRSPSIAQISPVCGLGSRSETFRPFPKVTDCISEA